MSIPTAFKTLKDHGFVCDVTTGWCEKHQPDGSVWFLNPYALAAEEVYKGAVTAKDYDNTLKRVERSEI